MKGQRTMVVMMVMVVLGMMMGVRAEPEACMQQLEHMRATNQTKVLAVMLDATGKAWNDLGKWDECKDLGSHISHYCTVSYKVPGDTSDSLTGFCLPSDCTVSDIVNLTGTAVMDLDHYIDWKLHNYTFFPPVVTILRDVDATLSKVANFTEHLKFDSVCSPPTPSIWSRPGAVVMIVLSLVIGIIVIMGTLLDGYDADWWPEPDTTVSSPHLGGIQDTAEVQPLLSAKGVHQRRSKLFDFFVAFSVARNFKSLVGPSPPGLAFLNGMRAISISWVILGHSLDYMNYAGVLNFAHVIVKDSKHGSAQAFPGAEFSVDSFFWLSGFLVTYLTVKELKTKNRMNWFLYYFHRVWRLSPAYFYALFFYMFVSVGISDGPMWPEYMEKVDQTCGKYWWTNLVYVNNFIPANNWQGQCFLWGWYLAVDMQLYIIAPIIFLLYHKKKILGWALVLILIVGSVVANGVIAHKEHLQWNALDPHVYMSMVYGKPYTRAAPWLLGIACAFLYLEKKQLQRIVVYIGWAVSGTVMALCIYGPTHQYIGGGSILEMGTFKNTWGDGSKAWTYFTFSKLGWSLAVSFLMYSMAMGWGGFFRRFLGAQMWSPLARLTYSAYLFHPIIMFVVYYSHLQFFSYDHFYMGVIYVGMLVLSFCTAVVMFLAIERPMTNMEKLFLPHKK